MIKNGNLDSDVFLGVPASPAISEIEIAAVHSTRTSRPKVKGSSTCQWRLNLWSLHILKPVSILSDILTFLFISFVDGVYLLAICVRLDLQVASCNDSTHLGVPLQRPPSFPSSASNICCSAPICRTIVETIASLFLRLSPGWALPFFSKDVIILERKHFTCGLEGKNKWINTSLKCERVAIRDGAVASDRPAYLQAVGRPRLIRHSKK